MTSIFTHTHSVSFGDCDPAGIVYYPNIFRWVDRTFHHWLRLFGGHPALCARLGATGIGLMDVSGRFRSPLRDGDSLEVRIIALDWASKSLRLDYRGQVGERLAFEATEVRGLFKPGASGLFAGPMDALRVLVTDDGRG